MSNNILPKSKSEEIRWNENNKGKHKRTKKAEKGRSHKQKESILPESKRQFSYLQRCNNGVHGGRVMPLGGRRVAAYQQVTWQGSMGTNVKVGGTAVQVIIRGRKGSMPLLLSCVVS